MTDVASVKSRSLAELEASGADLTRYIGSHPLAGRERGGPISARADLFIGRPWVIAGPETRPPADVGSSRTSSSTSVPTPVEMTAEEHDAARRARLARAAGRVDACWPRASAAHRRGASGSPARACAT